MTTAPFSSPATDLVNMVLNLLEGMHHGSDGERREAYSNLTKTVAVTIRMYPELEAPLEEFMRTATRIYTTARQLPVRTL